MAIRKILVVPNESLYKTCEPVKAGEDVSSLVSDLLDTLNSSTNPKGAGIAAPQIGVLKRVCIAKKFTPDPADPKVELETDLILINPEILTASDPKDEAWEGCLSIPDTYGIVERSKRIRVKAQDLKGQEFTLKADGYFARVILHEIDHLNGVLFTTKVIGRTYTESELDELDKKGH